MSDPQRTLIEVKDPFSKPSTQALKGSLYKLEIAASAVNGVSFVALLIITLATLSRTLFVPIWTDFGGAIQPRGEFPLIVTVLAFPFITSIFHAAQAADVYDFFYRGLVLGVTPHRWLEYSLTNGLITLDIYLLAGASNPFLVLSGLVLNALMNFFGYLHERANSTHQHSLGFLLVGFLPWVPLWFTPLYYYFVAASTVPTYYGIAIIGSFVISLLFPLPLFWRYYTRTEQIKANYSVKVVYAILSATAKLFLGWTVVVGNLVATA